MTPLSPIGDMSALRYSLRICHLNNKTELPQNQSRPHTLCSRSVDENVAQLSDMSGNAVRRRYSLACGDDLKPEPASRSGGSIVAGHLEGWNEVTCTQCANSNCSDF
jgi:hypothetical protein